MCALTGICMIIITMCVCVVCGLTLHVYLKLHEYFHYRFSVDVTRTGGNTTLNNPSSQANATGNSHSKPMYFFTPVDRYGDNKEMTPPLKDLGRSCLTPIYILYNIWHMGRGWG